MMISFKNSNMEFYGSQINFPLLNRSGYSSEMGCKLNEWKDHLGFELMFVVKGKVVYELESGEIVTVSGGSMSLLEDDTPHRLKDGCFSQCEIIWINLNPINPESILHTSYTLEDLQRLVNVFNTTKSKVVRSSPLIINLFKSYWEALHEWQKTTPHPRDNPDEPAQCSPELIVWIKILICAIITEASHCYAKFVKNSKCCLVQKACQFMQENFQDYIITKDVVKHLNVSYVYLDKLFSQDLGQTPSNYLRNLRLEKACQLLVNTDKKIIDIANEVGFSNSQRLASIFKKQAGESPSDFRQRLKSQKKAN